MPGNKPIGPNDFAILDTQPGLLHRVLGVAKGTKIPVSKLLRAAVRADAIGARARLVLRGEGIAYSKAQRKGK